MGGGGDASSPDAAAAAFAAVSSHAVAATATAGAWTAEQSIYRTRAWIDTAVVRLGLCPYAAKPFHGDRIRYAVRFRLRWGPRWTVPGLSRGQVGALGPSAPTLPWFGRGQGHAHLRSSRIPGAERGFVG